MRLLAMLLAMVATTLALPAGTAAAANDYEVVVLGLQSAGVFEAGQGDVFDIQARNLPGSERLVCRAVDENTAACRVVTSTRKGAWTYFEVQPDNRSFTLRPISEDRVLFEVTK